MEYKLINLRGNEINFTVEQDSYIVPKQAIERKFKVSWFRADLWDVVKCMFNEDRFWFEKFKII